MKRRDFLHLLKSLFVGASLVSVRRASAAPGNGRRVIVIGAGLAGLAAAQRLRARGHEVLVLEGRARIGGRIHTSSRWADIPLDLGATWIHESKGNPITKLASEINATLVTTRHADSIGYDTDGSVWTPSTEKQLEALRVRIGRLLLAAQDRDKDQSVRQALGAFTAAPADPHTQRLLNFLLSSEFETEYAGSADRLSAHWYDDVTGYSGPDKLFASGFHLITNSLAAGLDIRTGYTVEAIDWSLPEVRVATSKGQFTAGMVLVTLPLGVLKTGRPTFTPALPPAKSEAIDRLGMGLLNKCYLRFPRVFWPADVDWIEYIPATHGAWTEWVSFQKAADKPVLLGFLAAGTALAHERLTDSQTVASAMTALRKIYGRGIPEPTGFQITRWAADPFACGSYSFNALGSTPTMRSDLAAPLENRLTFAGEATEKTRFGTAHGAYLSGLRAAQQIEDS